MPPQESLQQIGTIGLAVYVIVEIAKQAGFPKRYGGVFSLILGLLIGSISHVILGKWWVDGLVDGFWGAASASGIYSSVQAVFQKKGQPQFQPPPVVYPAQPEVLHPDDPKLHPPC